MDKIIQDQKFSITDTDTKEKSVCYEVQCDSAKKEIIVRINDIWFGGAFIIFERL